MSGIHSALDLPRTDYLENINNVLVTALFVQHINQYLVAYHLVEETFEFRIFEQLFENSFQMNDRIERTNLAALYLQCCIWIADVMEEPHNDWSEDEIAETHLFALLVKPITINHIKTMCFFAL